MFKLLPAANKAIKNSQQVTNSAISTRHLKFKISFAKAITMLLFTIFGAALTIQGFYLYKIKQENSVAFGEFEEIKQEQDEFIKLVQEPLYQDHLKVTQKLSLEEKLVAVETELNSLKSGEASADSEDVDSVYSLYNTYKTKLLRNQNLKLDTKDEEASSDNWAQMLLDKNFDALQEEIQKVNSQLDIEHKEYLASLPPPPTSVEGYSYTTVTTEKGSHGVYLIKVPLNSVQIKTVAAIDSDCSDNCPTKSLSEYVKENNAFAGMNGSYACPPDYAECAGKVNSFDFALYDSNDKKWLNKDALTWFKTGMITFNGSSARFYKKTSEYDGDSVDAGVSNFPSLLKDKEIAIDYGELTSYQKVKALRGAIGVGGENLYLALITNATVEDAAYAMRALGAKHALNLDGGGTAAMYINGGYVVGPGRSLANAIVLVRK